jgi:hypothetical protein
MRGEERIQHLQRECMKQDVLVIVDKVRNILRRLNEVVDSGGLSKDTVVGPRSFVQLLECIPLIEGKKEPVAWEYHQVWVHKLTKEQQDKLIGVYIYEYIGSHKIIGIFNPNVPIEEN